MSCALRPIQERLREALAEAADVPFSRTLNILSGWFDEHVPPQSWLWRDEVDDDPERLRDLQDVVLRPRALTPLEKIAMLSHTVLNSTFCVLQAPPDREGG
jgi:hypothetical protein